MLNYLSTSLHLIARENKERMENMEICGWVLCKYFDNNYCMTNSVTDLIYAFLYVGNVENL